MFLWTFGKLFFTNLLKNFVANVRKNFSKRWKTWTESDFFYFFPKQNIFLQTVNSNTYKVVLTTRLKCLLNNQKKINNYNICTKHENLRKKSPRRNSIFSFFKKLQSISTKISGNWIKANMPMIACGLFGNNKLMIPT